MNKSEYHGSTQSRHDPLATIPLASGLQPISRRSRKITTCDCQLVHGVSTTPPPQPGMCSEQQAPIPFLEYAACRLKVSRDSSNVS